MGEIAFRSRRRETTVLNLDWVYQHECYPPLFIFCGRHLLSAKLRPANVDPAAGALTELQRIIAQIRDHWPAVQIVVRGDSAYSRDDIMSWCEGQNQVEFVTAHSSNARLRERTWSLEQRAKAAYEAQRQAVATSLEPFSARALPSWPATPTVWCPPRCGINP